MSKILLIEENDIIRAGIQNLLKSDNIFKITAFVKTATEAIQALNGDLIADIAVIGLQLGKDCGIELTHILMAQHPLLKVMIISMDNDDRNLSRALRAGAKGYILRDADFDELPYGLHKISQGKHFICSGLTGSLCRTLATRRSARELNPHDTDLSGRELEVLHLIANGYTNQEIANQLFASRRTIESHRQSVLNKTGTRNAAELIRYATLRGLLTMESAFHA